MGPMNLLEIINSYSTIILATVALIAVFFPNLWNWIKRPKLKISLPEINSRSLEVAIKNVGSTIAVNCYVRITLKKEKKDVLSEAGIAFITKSDPSVKIFEDYIAWGISPNPVRINIPPCLSDRAIIGVISVISNNEEALIVASEKMFSPPRVILEAKEGKNYSGYIIFGADNCKPKKTRFNISFQRSGESVIGSIRLLDVKN